MRNTPSLTADIAVGITSVVVCMNSQLGNAFRLSGIAIDAGEGFDTRFLTSCFLGYRTAVPAVVCGFFLGTDGASVLMGGIIHFSPAAVLMVGSLRDIFSFGGITASTGVCLCSELFAGCSFSHNTTVPSMVCRLYIFA